MEEADKIEISVLLILKNELLPPSLVTTDIKS